MFVVNVESFLFNNVKTSETIFPSFCLIISIHFIGPFGKAIEELLGLLFGSASSDSRDNNSPEIFNIPQVSIDDVISKKNSIVLKMLVGFKGFFVVAENDISPCAYILIEANVAF
jgi:hypothetical protein